MTLNHIHFPSPFDSTHPSDSGFSPPEINASRQGQSWSSRECATVAVMTAKGYSAVEIAAAVNRTGEAVVARLAAMHLGSRVLRELHEMYPDRPANPKSMVKSRYKKPSFTFGIR